jgi:hypothetical protein
MEQPSDATFPTPALAIIVVTPARFTFAPKHVENLTGRL